MDGISNSFEFHGVLCYSKPSAQLSYSIAPLYADLERDSNGRSMIGLIAIGTAGYLMFTAVWRAADDVIEALRIRRPFSLYAHIDPRYRINGC